jgi:hypothetical protein
MKHGMPSDASSALASSCADKRMHATATCFTIVRTFGLGTQEVKQQPQLRRLLRHCGLNLPPQPTGVWG